MKTATSMKKNKLIVSYEFDFKLLAIAAAVKGYKLAWSMNQHLNIRLKKTDDLILDIKYNKNIVISNFIFETEHSIFRLFKNKSVDRISESPGFLVPEYKDFDYIVMIKGFEDSFSVDDLIITLKEMDEIHFINRIDVNNLKSKENLIF